MVEGWIIFCRYVALSLSLVALVLPTIAFFGPNLAPFAHTIAHIKISPSIPSRRAAAPDGPTVWLGLFGTCSRIANKKTITCSNSFNVSVLPPNAPSYVLATPQPPHLKLIGYIVFALWPVMFLLLVVIHARFLNKSGVGWIEEFLLKSGLLPWLTTLTCAFGAMHFWGIRLYMRTTCHNFNDFVARQGTSAPQLVASLGEGFVLVNYAYIVFLVPWAIMLYDAQRLAWAEKAEEAPETEPEAKTADNSPVLCGYLIVGGNIPPEGPVDVDTTRKGTDTMVTKDTKDKKKKEVDYKKEADDKKKKEEKDKRKKDKDKRKQDKDKRKQDKDKRRKEEEDRRKKMEEEKMEKMEKEKEEEEEKKKKADEKEKEREKEVNKSVAGRERIRTAEGVERCKKHIGPCLCVDCYNS